MPRCRHCGRQTRDGAWVRWRYHTNWPRRPGGHWLPWGRGWMCARCQIAPQVDGDGRALGFELVSLARRPAARLLARR